MYTLSPRNMATRLLDISFFCSPIAMRRSWHWSPRRRSLSIPNATLPSTRRLRMITSFRSKTTKSRVSVELRSAGGLLTERNTNSSPPWCVYVRITAITQSNSPMQGYQVREKGQDGVGNKIESTFAALVECAYFYNWRHRKKCRLYV